MSSHVDVAITGGGIVGLATGLKLLERVPGLVVVVLEKESRIAAHQTGHNSGVIHSGLYYKPGSEKAKTCVEGRRLLVEFCERHSVPHEICGKLVVATAEAELLALENLERRAGENGLTGVRTLAPQEYRKIEPHAGGIRALHVPETGIVDYRAVCGKFAELITGAGGSVRTGARVTKLSSTESAVRLVAGGEEIEADLAVNCGGLQSDRLARLDGVDPGLRIVPFRGDYHRLVLSRAGLVKNLIYPVPDPRFPFRVKWTPRPVRTRCQRSRARVTRGRRSTSATRGRRSRIRASGVSPCGTWAWASARSTAPSASGRS